MSAGTKKKQKKKKKEEERTAEEDEELDKHKVSRDTVFRCHFRCHFRLFLCRQEAAAGRLKPLLVCLRRRRWRC